MAKVPSKINAGTHKLGLRWIEVVVSNNTCNGTGHFIPKSKKASRMTIGVSDKSWPETLSTFLHESFEMALVDLGCQVVRWPQYGEDTGNREFIFDHAKFDEACSRVAWFMRDALPAVTSAYRKLTRLTKRK